MARRIILNEKRDCMIKTEFRQYNLGEDLLKAIELLNFKKPTKVQAEVVPLVLKQKDVVVKSQTGSGKTAAFAIPISELVEWEENLPQALVLTPTRELALQVKEDFFNIGRFKRLRVPAVFGKSPFMKQVKELKQKTHVVVGTPGRVMDHIQRGTLDPSMIRYLVIDEADEMLNMGFVEQMEDIIKVLPQDRVTMLFSATMPPDVEDLCEKYLKNPELVEIEAQGITADKIKQVCMTVEEEDKLDLLQRVTVVENPESCVIFCNTKQKVDEVHRGLNDLEYSCDKIHGGMEQDERLKVMNYFRKGTFRYLVATDVAARGIDIDHITHVINYDIPQDPENYVHRIGRTGRKGRSGKAITFITPYEDGYFNSLEKYLERELEFVGYPSDEEVESNKAAFEEKMKERREEQAAKGEKLNEEILKIHINAGKKTKLRPVDVVGTLCNIEGMTAADIGIITILDVSTFVEILNNKGEFVLEALQTKPIKGRLRRVSRADA